MAVPPRALCSVYGRWGPACTQGVQIRHGRQLKLYHAPPSTWNLRGGNRRGNWRGSAMDALPRASNLDPPQLGQVFLFRFTGFTTSEVYEIPGERSN